MKRLFLAAAPLAILAACATEPAPVDTSAPSPAEIATASEYERAMITVEGLEDAGNTPTAIDRLTQLLGDTSLTDAEKAEALFKRGQLRMSDTGYDTWGAISDFEEILDRYPTSAVAAKTQTELDYARGKATSLNFLAENPEASRQDRFEALFQLGDHDEAIDLMLGAGLTPDNETLIAMYQIGYLCDGDEQTGPEYEAVEPDGTQRTLKFCDFGK